MPKSDTFTPPSNETSTFDGETSRWTIPSGSPPGPQPLVRVVQAVRRRRDDRQRRAERQGRRQVAGLARVCAQELAQVGAVHVLHREERRVAVGADVVDLGDVRAGQRRRQPRLVDEHPQELGIQRVLRQDALQHHELLEPLEPDARDAREKDLGHAADGQPADRLVPPDGWPERSLAAIRRPEYQNRRPRPRVVLLLRNQHAASFARHLSHLAGADPSAAAGLAMFLGCATSSTALSRRGPGLRGRVRSVRWPLYCVIKPTWRARCRTSSGGSGPVSSRWVLQRPPAAATRAAAAPTSARCRPTSRPSPSFSAGRQRRRQRLRLRDLPPWRAAGHAVAPVGRRQADACSSRRGDVHGPAGRRCHRRGRRRLRRRVRPHVVRPVVRRQVGRVLGAYPGRGQVPDLLDEPGRH